MSGKTFVRLNSGLISSKHVGRMGTAIWLFIYLLELTWVDGTTKDWQYQMAEKALGKSRMTIRRWKDTLESEGYVKFTQTLRGFDVKIAKWSGSKSASKTKKKTKTVNGSEHQEIFAELAGILRKDPKTSGGRIAKLSKQIREAGYSIDQLRTAFGAGGAWWTQDWRGKKNQPPTYGQVLEHIGEYSGKIAGVQAGARKTMAQRSREIQEALND